MALQNSPLTDVSTKERFFDFRFEKGTRFTSWVSGALPRRNDTCCRVEAALVLGNPNGAFVRSTVAR
jgi:hypothetical protein